MIIHNGAETWLSLAELGGVTRAVTDGLAIRTLTAVTQSRPDEIAAQSIGTIFPSRSELQETGGVSWNARSS
jgi:hypothetical protein